MSTLTAIGIPHTLVSAGAVVAGLVCLAQAGVIRPWTFWGRIYAALTALSCLTGFFIFQHGGFGKPHALGILELMVLTTSWLAAAGRLGQRARPFGEVGMSFSLFLHAIPGVTETFTRLPSASPLFNGPEDASLQQLIAVLFAAFVVAAVVQWRWLKARQADLS